MMKKIHPKAASGSGGEPNLAYDAITETKPTAGSMLEDGGPVKQAKFKDVVDLQLDVDAARKGWQDYVTRKRALISQKTDSSIRTFIRLGGSRSAVQESNLGLEIDPKVLKEELSHAAALTNGAITPQGPATKQQENKLNRKLIEHFVMLNKEPPETAEVDLDHIKSLLDKGANINCHDRYGQTVLHEAARLWHPDIALFLIEHGADVKKSDKYGRTSLHVAAAVNYPEMIELLLEKGADLEALTAKELQTPLHFAARNDAVEACKTLTKFGAEIEAEDSRKRTPLQAAAELDRSETARWLVEQHAVVGRCDDTGQSCMTHMITKMGPVANDALDTFHKTDRTNRRQYFYLNLLEPDITGISGTWAKTPLQVIVSYKQLDIIMHPVILKLLELKWQKFGRFGAIKLLLSSLLHILLWTSLAVGVNWQTRYLYVLPGTDVWRVVVWILAVVMTIYYIVIEVIEISTSRRKFNRWKDWRTKNIERDIRYCHPKWPEERDYLEREVENLDDMLPGYFRDFWNFFDWTVYFLNFCVLITHIADIFAYDTSNRPAPCCGSIGCDNTEAFIRAGNLTDKESCALPGAFVNNASLSVWVNRIFVINILMMWLRLMKNMRSFRRLGPFVVMLGKIFYDIVRFLFLYFEFYIPYACAFWMIFGNEPSIDSMSTVDQMLFSLYRITLVDDYQYDEMHTFDVVMTYFLVGTFLGVSAILCINLFIALLSDTFQRVYDNANANAVMQQAIQILSMEEYLSEKQKRNFRKCIQNPIEEFYDDDLTTSQEDSLKKATIQIREQMVEVLEHVRAEQREKRELEEHLLLETSSQTDGRQFHKTKHRRPLRGDDMYGTLPGRSDAKRLSSTITSRAGVAKLSSDLTSVVAAFSKYQNVNERVTKKMQRDIREIKLMLTQLLPDPDWRTSQREAVLLQRSATPLSIFEQPTFPLEITMLNPTENSRERKPHTHKGTTRPRSALSQEELLQTLRSSHELQRPRGRSSWQDSADIEMGLLPGASDHSTSRLRQDASPEGRPLTNQPPVVVIRDANLPDIGQSDI